MQMRTRDEISECFDLAVMEDENTDTESEGGDPYIYGVIRALGWVIGIYDSPLDV